MSISSTYAIPVKYKKPEYPAPTLEEMPKSQAGRGRIIYTNGETETWVQALWAPDDELKNYLISSRMEIAA